MKKNVLVFPCGTEVGLEIGRSLQYSTHFTTYGGSSIDDHGKFSYKNYIGNIPYVYDQNFISRLNDVIQEYGIDYIYPAHDDVVLALAREASQQGLRCSVVTSPYDTCEIARSKRRTHETFRQIVATPKLYGDVSEASYPAFVKPDKGQGSRGAYLVQDATEAAFYIDKHSDQLIMEYLPGREYTVDCFTDRNGKLLYSEGRERIRTSSGISVCSEFVDNPRIYDISKIINENLAFRGPWFFQLKENADGELALLEIASRIAGTMGLSRSKGVNLPLLGLFDAMDYDVEITKNSYHIRTDRALQARYSHNIQYQHVYIDLDDLLILENKVNPTVVSFVYQCINQNKKVHLLSKHKQDIHSTLASHRLQNMFDEIIVISDDKEKCDYIAEQDAIFVDDSFEERRKVSKKLGIPVFDAHMIEALMEKF